MSLTPGSSRRRPRPLSQSRGLDFRKSQARPAEPGGVTGMALPASDHDVAIARCIAAKEAVRPQKPKIARP